MERRARDVALALAGLIVVVGAVLFAESGPFALPSEPASPTPPGRTPTPSIPGPTATPAASPGLPLQAGVTAMTTREVVPQWDPGREGRPVRNDEGLHDEPLLAHSAVYIVDGPVEVDGEPWVRAYVLPNQRAWPSDFYAWLPGSALAPEAPAECPRQVGFSVQQLAAVTGPDRLRCWGGQEITLEAWTWLQRSLAAYAVEPAWYGSPFDRLVRITLVDPDDGFAWAPHDWAWIDAQLRPGVPEPPLDFLLRVNGHFDDPAAADCRRTYERRRPGDGTDPPGGLPDESPADSQAWCRQQFAITGWAIVLGPERRPLKAGVVQLHRFTPLSGLCAGVGLPELTFRMDAARVDPIRLEGEGLIRPPLIPVFGPGFRAVTTPELAVTGPRSEVVARDGTRVDPTRPWPVMPSAR